ncbi:aminopeptidase N-like [Asbolus verrucosus]|uniref:Aminopeptidase n=1 Tax=Asbolus verrucosus TaxID=1661398 RepID=A0A482VS19_ASBVE|nr:aminopeptidase N-like [Asbolus verrucosus]
MFSFFYFIICWICVSSSVSSYRLPSIVIPSHYKLEILSYLGEPENFNFDGKVWIQVTSRYPTQNITLHSKDLTIIKDQITAKDISRCNPENVKIENIQLDPQNDFLIIYFERQLSTDHKYEIFIPFMGVTLDSMKGFYRSSYIDENTKEKKWLGVTQFEATSARKAFPCFDEPAMKAVFEITLGRKENYSSISNMPLIKTEPIKEKQGWVWDKYEPSVPMSTYLVAWVISDFDFITSPPSKNNVTFRVWTRKNALNQVDFANEVGPKFLEYFEDFFGIKYPLPKQDMVAIPDFNAGAMENWGLITYRESALLFDSKISSTTSQHRIANTIAHELAHQWFGNLVTMKWWTDLWLNEGFATYMASRAVADVFPRWNALEGSVVNNILSLFTFDALKSSHPVSVTVGHPNEIDEIFDTISYKKGSYLLRMMSLFLGEETLKRGVSNYLKKHKYNNAEQDDLWESLTEEAQRKNVLPSNLTVKTIMDTWTLQTGYPILNVKRDYEKNSALITQQRFIKDEIRPREETCWWVPLSYTNAKDLDFNSTKPKSWLSCPKETITVEGLPDENTWVIFNVQLSSLYRVNYDERNWNLLSDTLNSEDHKNIPILDKVQLLDGAFNLAWTGNLKYDVVYNLVKYLKFEEEYLPWNAVLTNLNTLHKQLKKTSVFGSFQTSVKRLIAPAYEKMGGFHIPEEKRSNPDFIKHQVAIVSKACRYGVSNCVADAQELFRKYQKNPEHTATIPKDFRSVIYCTAVKNGGEKEWEFLWDQYRKSNVATEMRSILGNLACTRELWLLQRYLEWSIDPNSGIRKQDAASVFADVISNDVGYYLAKNFLYARIKDIYNYLSQTSKRLGTYVNYVGSQTTSKEDYEEFQKFVKENQKYLKGIKQGVEQSLETAKLNIQWQQRHLHDIEELLHKENKKEKYAV